MPAQRAKTFLLWLLKPFYSRDRQYWKVVLLCFAAASTFWLLNALNKNYTNIRTSYPLAFVYDEEKYIPLQPLPDAIEINVSGKGWKLLRKSLRLDVRPAEIFIQSVPRFNFLPGPALRSNVVSVLDGLQLNFILTDTVEFSFDRRVRRKLRLTVDSTGIRTAPDAFIVSPLVVAPDSVIFDGPASLVNKLPSPFPVKVPTSNIDRSFKRFVPLDYPSKSLVKANISEVEVSFAVSPLTWQEVQVQPTFRNLPPALAQQMAGTTVTISYALPTGRTMVIQPDQFEAVVDYNTFTPLDSTVAVRLTRQPAVVKRAVVEPRRIRLILLPQ